MGGSHQQCQPEQCWVNDPQFKMGIPTLMGGGKGLWGKGDGGNQYLVSIVVQLLGRKDGQLVRKTSHTFDCLKEGSIKGCRQGPMCNEGGVWTSRGRT